MQLLAHDMLQQLPASLIPRLIDMFSATTPELLGEIQQTAANGDLLAMSQAAHKLKGSCLSLGAERMAELCQTLQHQGERNDATGMDGYITELVSIYPTTLAAMKSL